MAAVCVLTLGVAAPGGAPQAEAASSDLDLGRSGLTEIRTSEVLAEGVTLTHIVRGSAPADSGQIQSTSRGPWRINVLTIDPDQAKGTLRATYGTTLAQVAGTTDLVKLSDAVVGVNAGYFTFGGSKDYPGDPVGLGLYGGKVLSEPAAAKHEVDLLVDAKTNKVRVERLSWKGELRNTETDRTARLEYLNHPPVVPSGCTRLSDPTDCRASGDLVQFSSYFGASTPSGRGVEVVLDSDGCVVRTLTTKRGVTLTRDQSSLQATGRETTTLLKLVRGGCVTQTVKLYDEDGKKISLHSGMFGVAGRYELIHHGKFGSINGSGSYFARNPRTFAGATSDGVVKLVTIDGRRVTSVGTTLAETARVARSLGLYNAVNLDGGGSTTLSVRGELTNQPSGSKERSIGDALVYVDTPFE